VGVNLSIPDDEFPPDLRWPGTSIGGGAGSETVLDELNSALGRWVEAPAPEVLDGFAARDALRGREVSWDGSDAGSGTGIAAGVDERGNLLVDSAAGERVALGAGEVSLTL
jgi:biotin-(acetyl-CoA carboxylase) ligase